MYMCTNIISFFDTGNIQ